MHSGNTCSSSTRKPVCARERRGVPKPLHICTHCRLRVVASRSEYVRKKHQKASVFHDLTSYEATVHCSWRGEEFHLIVTRAIISCYRNTARAPCISCSGCSVHRLYGDLLGVSRAIVIAFGLGYNDTTKVLLFLRFYCFLLDQVG